MQLPGDSHAIVAISCDGQSTILALGAKPRRAVAIFKELDCAPVGCIAKSLTARLMLEASADGVVTLDDLVGNALGRAEQSLQGVTVRSLLNHTHGLDGAGLTHVAREPSGMLDVDWLVKTVVRPRPLFSPGALYSYGSVGAWLSACILERLYGVTFETLLRERLLAPLHRDANDHRLAESKSICPAVGGVDLRLSTCILMKFLDWHQQFSTLRAKRIAASMTQATVPIRGWSRAVASGLGWKHFGGGWFGHSGIWNGVHTVLRFNTMFRCAVAVKSTGIPATSVLARLWVPRYRNFTVCPLVTRRTFIRPSSKAYFKSGTKDKGADRQGRHRAPLLEKHRFVHYRSNER